MHGPALVGAFVVLWLLLGIGKQANIAAFAYSITKLWWPAQEGKLCQYAMWRSHYSQRAQGPGSEKGWEGDQRKGENVCGEKRELCR
jgi:hypothetical protein